MAEEALTNAQRQQVEDVAELTTRRYFDHYLKNVWPQQAEELERQCQHRLQHHDGSAEAHGGVERKLNRLIWMGIGIALASGAGGAGIARVLMGL